MNNKPRSSSTECMISALHEALEATKNYDSNPKEGQTGSLSLATSAQLVPDDDHATLHGQPLEPTLADKALLSEYNFRILRHLQGGNREFARVGAYLCMAKDAMAEGQILSNEREQTFTDWYINEFSLSQDRARRYMRWVRPVLKDICWEHDDDPMLEEIAAIGPCLFDEVQKLPEGMWRFNDAGKLVITTDFPGHTEVEVRGLSISKVRQIREKMNDGTPTKGTNCCFNQNDLNEAARFSHGLSLNDDTCGMEINSHTGNPLAEDTDDWDYADDEICEESVNATIDCGHESTGILPDSPGGELWNYVDKKEAKLSVVIGKFKTSDSDSDPCVSGVNVTFELSNNRPCPAAINTSEDAFYASKADTGITIHWYDHLVGHWHAAEVTTQTTAQ